MDTREQRGLVRMGRSVARNAAVLVCIDGLAGS